jgi:hypothetical protein
MGFTALVEEHARLLVAVVTEVAAMELNADVELRNMRCALDLLVDNTSILTQKGSKHEQV